MANELAARRFKRVLESMKNDPFVLIVLPPDSDEFQVYMSGITPEQSALVQQLVETINRA